jgi:hypothetical protein
MSSNGMLKSKTKIIKNQAENSKDQWFYTGFTGFFLAWLLYLFVSGQFLSVQPLPVGKNAHAIRKI